MPQYKQLAKNHIRLLSLHPGSFHDTIHTTLRSAPLFLTGGALSPYLALSYVWGDATHLKQIQCDGQPMAVTASLASALRYMRLEDDEAVVWADAVCINQADKAERSEQVSLMRHIYARAERVIIWVGEADEETADVVAWFEQMDEHFEKGSHRVELEYIITQSQSQNQNQSQTTPPPPRPSAVPSFSSPEIASFQHRLECVRRFVERRPWFRRAWTFQEACLASSAELRCGHARLPWLTLCTASIVARDVGIAASAFGDAKEHVATLAYYSVMTQVADTGTDGAFRLGHLLRQTRTRAATDARDKVYSLLGLCTSGVEAIGVDASRFLDGIVRPDYTASVEEVYTTTAAAIISHDGCLDILSDAGSRGNSLLPSWVPDWRDPTSAAVLARESDHQGVEGALGPVFAAAIRPPLPTAPVSSNPDRSMLAVSGTRIGRVSRVSPLDTLRSALQAAQDLSRGNEHERCWRGVVSALLSFAEDLSPSPQPYPRTGEPMLIALLRTLSADTLPIMDRVAAPLRIKSFPWHHDWHRQEIDVSVRAHSRKVLLERLSALHLRGERDWDPEPRYRARAVDMSVQLRRVYGRLFVGGDGSGRRSSSAVVADMFASSLSALTNDTRPKTSYFGSDFVRSKMMAELAAAVLEWTRERAFIVTDTGLLGMGPASNCGGQDVYILDGARVPFMLRPVLGDAATAATAPRHGDFALVGECYIHGYMYGVDEKDDSGKILGAADGQRETVTLV